MAAEVATPREVHTASLALSRKEVEKSRAEPDRDDDTSPDELKDETRPLDSPHPLPESSLAPASRRAASSAARLWRREA
jgi:hypothetical protein